MTLESIPEDLSTAGEHNGEYLEIAKKGGRKGNLSFMVHGTVFMVCYMHHNLINAHVAYCIYLIKRPTSNRRPP